MSGMPDDGDTYYLTRNRDWQIASRPSILASISTRTAALGGRLQAWRYKGICCGDTISFAYLFCFSMTSNVSIEDDSTSG